MQKERFGLHRPLDVFYMLGPPMAACLLPFAYTLEVRHGFSSDFGNAELFSCVVLQALIALAMQLAEFFLIAETSSMTFSVRQELTVLERHQTKATS
jgi:hypothetical protein